MSTDEAAEAVVLRFAAFGEADRMASLLMSDGSRREVRVAQARKSKRRFGGFDLYVRAECRFTPDRKGRARLESVEVRDGHDGLRDDLVRSALAAHVAELVVQASQEGHPLPDLFRLSLAAFASIAAGGADEAPQGWARGFELKLLHVLGVRPALLKDASSGAPLEEGGVRWSTTHGGPINGDGPTDARSLAIDLATLRRMNDALRTPLADQSGVSWSDAAITQASRALQDFLAVHVGRRARARSFLNDVLGALPAVAVLGLALLGSGCAGYQSPSSVRVQGWLYESPDPITDTPVVPDSGSRALADDGTLIAEGTEPFSDAPGYVRFSAMPPLTRHHHVFVPPPGEDHPEVTEHLTTVVTGLSGSDDLFLDAGEFHLWPRATVDGWLTAWELVGGDLSLPALDPEEDGGGFLRGVVLEPDAWLGARFALVDAAATRLPAVYLDAEGAPSSSQEGLSESGGFFIFGAEAGVGIVHRIAADDSLEPDGLPVWIEEDGVTSLPSLRLGG
ncbi:MAG: DNA repair protein RecO [Deltaproteobacteria bacterium]|nr:DNA repair protein RecO [Deltaproteobacteria bacterium]